MLPDFKVIRKWLALGFYTFMLTTAPLLHSTTVTPTPQSPVYQMVCSSGGSCGNCC